ncbi:hypothetical protein ACNAW0_02360 [Micromonospora sp. SL1-18]|uniref:hypothetical protein n=1 Tax=Micromonospora sp. SL1-18 TaxID=3399128 RepID=UPI003A4D756D
MLPIALTCPLWWVARWTARMLASLAVVAACSLGAAALPLGPAATAQAAAPTPAVDTSALRAGHLSAPEPGANPALRGLLRWSDRAADAVAGAGTGAPGAVAGRGEHAAPGTDPAGAAQRQVVQGDLDHAERAVLSVGGPGRVVAAPVDRQRVLVGLVPAAAGPRAPPAR